MIFAILVVFYGCIIMGLAFLVEHFDINVQQSILSVFGTMGGPMLGVVILAMFFPWSNTWVSKVHYNKSKIPPETQVFRNVI